MRRNEIPHVGGAGAVDLTARPCLERGVEVRADRRFVA